MWYARQIAKQAVAAGCHAETIRRHMTGRVTRKGGSWLFANNLTMLSGRVRAISMPCDPCAPFHLRSVHELGGSNRLRTHSCCNHSEALVDEMLHQADS